MATRKRSFRKVPLFIQTRLSSFGHQFKVAVVKRVPMSEVKAGEYASLGLTWQNGMLTASGPVLPEVAVGRSSRRNVEGLTIVRRDLPKIEKVIHFVNSNAFGKYGPCNVTQIRMVLQREFVEGPRLSLEGMPLLVGDDSCIVRFDVGVIFDKSNPNLDEQLLFTLNLLQENVAGVNVFPPNATTQDYLNTVQVNWQILSPGERDSNIRQILSSYNPRTPEAAEELLKRAEERYDLFLSLNPKHIIRGTGGMDGYMGALVNDELVVFEHLTPGNGTYVLFGDWEVQSQRTKSDLLSNGVEGIDYIRIIHTGDWQLRIKNLVASRVN
jgi:hypothetical protein